MTWTDKRLVVVEWLDANCDNTWQSQGAEFKLSTCWTVGLLMYEDDNVVAIAGTIAEHGDFNQTMTIPKPVVSIEDVNLDAK